MASVVPAARNCLLEAVEGRENQDAGALVELADDVDAVAVDAERRDVHPQYLRVVGERPRLDLEQETAGGEQLLYRIGGYAPVLEVARFVALTLHRRDHLIEEGVEFRRRGDRDGYFSCHFGANLGSSGRIGNPDAMGLAW